MGNWLANPIARYAVRHSIGWMRLMPLMLAVFVEMDRRAAGRPLRIALMALCYAAPQAAGYLLEAEHDGRLDQMRLSGRTPEFLATNAAISAAAVWVAIGAAAMIWMLASGDASLNALLGMVAIAGLPTAMATAAATAPVRVDPRIVVPALSLFSIAIAVYGANLLRFASPNWYFVATILVEGALVAWCLPTLLRRIAHAPVVRQSRPWTLHPPPLPWLLRWPGVYRGLCLSASGVALFVLFAPLPLIAAFVRNGRSYEPDARAFFLPPLIIGLIAVSLICREDATSGRLELVRQSPRSATLATFEMLVGLWAPFVVVSIGVALVTLPLFSLSGGTIVSTVSIAAMAAPLPLLEGWSRHWPFMTMVPFMIVLVMLRQFDAMVPLTLVVAIGWCSAIRLFGNPDRPIFPGWSGVIVAALLCAALFLSAPANYRGQAAPWAAGILFLLSQVLIDPKPKDRLATWGQPLAVLVITLGAIGIADGADRAVRAAVIVVAVWFCAFRIRQIFPEQPELQIALRTASVVFMVTSNEESLRTYPPTFNLLSPTNMLVAAIAAAAVLEAGHRIAGSLSRRRSAALTPLT